MGEITPAQHVVQPVERSGALDGLHVARLRHHADATAVARGVVAHVAVLARGVVEADRAEVHLLLHPQDGVRQAARGLRVCLQQVVRDALGRLGPNARQPAQLVKQALQRAAVARRGRDGRACAAGRRTCAGQAAKRLARKRH
jgi:hypothetical protein